MEKMDVKKFVEVFNQIKTEEKGRRGTVRGLSEKDERNFKKLIKRGFTEEEFRVAITQMFRDPEQWAVNTGNDIPTHFLRSDNFDRYLNAALNIEAEKEAKKEQEEKREKPEDKSEREKLEAERKAEEFLREARELYRESLKRGEWIGTEFHANVIARDLAVFLDQLLKASIWRGINEENEKAERFKQSLVISKILKDQRTKFINPVREFSNRIVIEAVKQKIVDKW